MTRNTPQKKPAKSAKPPKARYQRWWGIPARGWISHLSRSGSPLHLEAWQGIFLATRGFGGGQEILDLATVCLYISAFSRTRRPWFLAVRKPPASNRPNPEK